MTTNIEFVQTALTQKGKKYIFGAEASPLDPDPDAFDCSELVEWTSGRLHVLPTVPDGAFNQWKHCMPIPVEKAIWIPGALGFHGDGTGVGRDAIGHVVIFQGNGLTIEGRGKNYGVNVFSAFRGFQYAGLIPGLTYLPYKPYDTQQGTIKPLVMQEGSKGKSVEFLQTMLNIVRSAGGRRKPITVDGDFGKQTAAAVKEFKQDYNKLMKKNILPVDHIADMRTCAAIGSVVRLVLSKHN